MKYSQFFLQKVFLKTLTLTFTLAVLSIPVIKAQDSVGSSAPVSSCKKSLPTSEEPLKLSQVAQEIFAKNNQLPKSEKKAKIPFRVHPWHGIPCWNSFPKVLNSYIEIVPSDSFKFEIDKDYGLLKIDRPQKYSTACPALYGFIPQTLCDKNVADYCMKKTGLVSIKGDGDALDICVLTDRPAVRGDILAKAIPIGGFRMIDGGEADDKIIAVLPGDPIYGALTDIRDCPANTVERLHHYFLTYKEMPSDSGKRKVQITHTYGPEEAKDVIRLSQQDYEDHYE